jgi:hypothetical protein
VKGLFTGGPPIFSGQAFLPKIPEEQEAGSLFSTRPFSGAAHFLCGRVCVHPVKRARGEKPFLAFIGIGKPRRGNKLCFYIHALDNHAGAARNPRYYYNVSDKTLSCTNTHKNSLKLKNFLILAQQDCFNKGPDKGRINV